MKIIVIGIGQVGYHIVEKLVPEDHEITVVDASVQRIDHIARVVDVETIVGSGTSPATLQAAGIGWADLVIACSDSDEVNLVTCVLAQSLKRRYTPDKQKLEQFKTIARVYSREMSADNPALMGENLFGVDLYINQNLITCQEIIRIIKLPGAVEVIPFARDRVELVGFRVSEDSLFRNHRIKGLRDIPAFANSIIVAIQRKEDLIIPDGNTFIKSGDILFFVAPKAEFQEISGYFTDSKAGTGRRKMRIFILGGGRLTEVLTDAFLDESNIEVKIVDSNLARVYELSEKYPRNVFCLHGHATDLDLLREEGISDTDFVIAATPDEDTNIVASVLCKEYGARKTIAIVQDPDYVKIKMMPGIDIAISPKILTSGEVLKLIRSGFVQKAAPILEKGAEILEIALPPNTPEFNRPLSELGLPPNSIMGAVVRDDEVIIPHGDFRILGGDKVILFVMPDARKKVEQIFNPGNSR